MLRRHVAPMWLPAASAIRGQAFIKYRLSHRRSQNRRKTVHHNVKSSSASSFLFSMNSLRRRKKSKKKSSKVAPSTGDTSMTVTSPKLKDQQKVLLDNCNSDSEINMRSLSSVDMDIRLKVPQFDTDSRLGHLGKEFSRVMRVEEDGGF